MRHIDSDGKKSLNLSDFLIESIKKDRYNLKIMSNVKNKY